MLEHRLLLCMLLRKTIYFICEAKYGQRNSDFEKLIVKTNEYEEIISVAKDKYIIQMCEKLNDPLTAPKTYWKIKNRLLSNNKFLPCHLYWLMGK